MTDPQPPTSHTSYSFASLRYWCTSCQRPFSQLSVNENTTSQAAHCPRCDTLSDPQSQPTTPSPSTTTALQPYTSSPQGQSQAQEESYMYLTEVIETPFGGVLIRTIRIPVANISQETFASTTEPSGNDEDIEEQVTTGPDQDENAGNPPDMLAHLLESLFGNVPAQSVFNMFAPILEERLLEEFLRNDPNQYGPPPASEEAIKKLEEIKFDGMCQEKEEIGLCCSICKEEYQQDESLVKLPCKHDYHRECVNMWLSKHNSCPMCRQAI